MAEFIVANEYTGRKEPLNDKPFGRLVVVGYAGYYPDAQGHKKHAWKCVCSCGKEKVVRDECLRNGDTQSCGCRQAEMVRQMRTTHGKGGSRLYRVWNQMVQRCTNPNHAAYDNYGGRGITVCDKWLAFAGFYEDMGESLPGMTLDRIDNDTGYFKENCRWASRIEQGNNKRNNRLLTFRGKTQSIRRWAMELGFSYLTVYSRIVRDGWSAERALTVPVRHPRAKVSGTLEI